MTLTQHIAESSWYVVLNSCWQTPLTSTASSCGCEQSMRLQTSADMVVNDVELCTAPSYVCSLLCILH